jgi:porin
MKTYVITFIVLLESALGAMAQEPVASGMATGMVQTWNPYTAMTNAGVSFPASYTGEVLGNPTGGHRQGVVYDGLVKAGVTVDLGKFANWQGATLTVDGLYPHGSSLTRNDVRDYNVLSNIDTQHNPRLYEAWIEQDLDGGKFSIRAGQVPVDTEFFFSTNGAVFINSAFGVLPSIGQNVNVAVYPVAAPGVRLRATPNDSWSLQGGVFDGNVGNLKSTDRNGLRFNLNGRDGAFLIGEVDYTLHPPPAAPPDGKQTTERPLSGTYKLGGFYDTGDYAEDTTGRESRGDYGFYFITDQELWHVPGAPDEGLRGFGRLGVAPGNRNQVEFYCDGGLNYQGLIPGRTQDLLGLGVSYSKLSDDLRDAGGNPYPNHYETIVELTYQAVLTGWLNVQPDIQYILNPGALGTQRDTLVLGLRFNMTF